MRSSKRRPAPIRDLDYELPYDGDPLIEKLLPFRFII